MKDRFTSMKVKARLSQDLRTALKLRMGTCLTKWQSFALYSKMVWVALVSCAKGGVRGKKKSRL